MAYSSIIRRNFQHISFNLLKAYFIETKIKFKGKAYKNTFMLRYVYFLYFRKKLAKKAKIVLKSTTYYNKALYFV